MADFIVVGAGAAGCVLANRLTEDEDASVLLLEAGPVDGAPEIEMPIAFPTLFKGRYDWDFTTEREPGLEGRSIAITRGRVLGGSTSLNAMVYTRGGRWDYDRWAQMGATGWGYDDILPYFRKSEDNERGPDEYHGVGGPQTISNSRFRHPLTEVMLEAAPQAGHPINHDVNGAELEGIGDYQFFTRDGRRCSNAKSFLRPALGRANLDVLTDAQVLRILFDGTRAVGVETVRFGQVQQHYAEREVILCAGAVQSPHLLMVSGIGPESELAPFGIEVRENLPVGQGLQDHTTLVISYLSDTESLLSAFSPENVALYERGDGPLATNLSGTGGFIRATDGSPHADFQIFSIGALYTGGATVTQHGVSIAGNPCFVSDRGAVTLRSADPLSKPRLVHNYMVSESDRQTMRGGVRRILDLFETPAYRAHVTEPFMAPASRSDADIDAYVRHEGLTSFHQASSCAIGSVVDADLRVMGFEGLRVIDASVMPDCVGANTTAPTTMIAEKGADLIRGIDSRRPPQTAAATA